MSHNAIVWIKEPAQVKALESPMRQEIVDAITTIGPCSMADLAEYLGRAADSLYFHVRKLVKVKLVQEVEKRKEGRHEWAIYAMDGRSARIVYSPAVMKSIRKVVAGATRLNLREFTRAITQKSGTFTGPYRNLWGGRAKGWLGKKDLEELNQLLEKLLQIMSRHGPGEDRKVHSLGWLLAPGQIRQRTSKPALKKGL